MAGSAALGPSGAREGVIRSLIPARIDRLPWAPFHTRMVIALGVAWVLDGLEITIAGAVAGVLTEKARSTSARRRRPDRHRLPAR